MINLNDVVPQNESVQKVEVVNQNGTSENPQVVSVSNLSITPGGFLNTNVIGGSVSLSSIRPSATTLYNVFLDNILLLQGDGTFVAIPLNSFFLSLSNTFISNLLDSYKTAYATLVSGVTAATLHYSKQSSNGAVTSEIFNLKD